MLTFAEVAINAFGRPSILVSVSRAGFAGESNDDRKIRRSRNAALLLALKATMNITTTIVDLSNFKATKCYCPCLIPEQLESQTSINTASQ